MKRNPILVLGLGVLLSFGVFAVGCGDDDDKKNDGAITDAKSDIGSTDGAISTGGVKGTGGAPSTGGATGTDGGAGGVGGTGGTSGTGGTPGLDGGKDSPTPSDGSLDTAKDSLVDVPVKYDSLDGHLPLDSNPIDAPAVDVAQVRLDTAIDNTPVALDAAVVDAEEIDSLGVDGSTD